jgi:ADP-ribose pyrophosphatase YjhB (NUDIX family)
MAPSLRLSRHPDRARYVLGFAFNESGTRVALIHQQRGPATGALNGIGGRVRKTETYVQAMHRTFFTQAGVLVTSGWMPFAVIEADDRRVMIYRADLTPQAWHAIHSESDEAVQRCSTGALPDQVHGDVASLVALGLNPMPTAVVRFEYRPL